MLSLFLAKGIIMLSLQNLNHEFIGKGDPHVESLRLKEKYEQNLTPEELKKLVDLSPMVNEFMALDFKGRTGKFPEGQRDKPIENVPLEEQMTVEEYGRMRGLDEEYIQEVMAGVNGPKEVFSGDAPPVSRTPMGDAPPVSRTPTGNAHPVKEAQPEERFFPSADPRQEFALGTEDLQQQEQIQGMPPVQEVVSGAGSGLIEDPQDPNASPVADTVPMDNVEEGSAIINAAAVQIVGLKDLMKARDEARGILRAQGVVIDDEQQYQGDGVDIATSNGEFKFTAKEVEIIGQETIDKWNKKGAAQTEEAIANEQPQQPQQLGMPPIMGAKKGIIVGEEGDSLASRIYEGLAHAETGSEKDPFIRTRVIPEGGSSAFGPVQVTQGLIRDDRFNKFEDIDTNNMREQLNLQSEEFLKYGNNDWKKMLEAGKINQQVADHARDNLEYGKKGIIIFDEANEERYKKYATGLIRNMLEHYGVTDTNSNEFKEFIRHWRGTKVSDEDMKKYMNKVNEKLNPSLK